MSTSGETIDLQDWLRSAPERRRRAAELDALFSEPYKRERPRDPAEAKFLRSIGTPEHLIGPEQPGGVSEQLLQKVKR
jgi:hypothetical protein